MPARFLIVVGFNATFTKGVYVSRDAQNSGESFTGLPGQTPRTYRDGDWLIRARLDQRLKQEAGVRPYILASFHLTFPFFSIFSHAGRLALAAV